MSEKKAAELSGGKLRIGLRQHCEGSMFDRCGECPYYDPGGTGIECRDELLKDANEMLRVFVKVTLGAIADRM